MGDSYHLTGPARGKAFIVYVCLRSQADSKLLITPPTIETGDFKISKDGGAFANLATLPTVTPSGGVAVKVEISATEAEADNILVVWQDQSSTKEWCSDYIDIQTAPGLVQKFVVDDATLTPTASAFETDLTEDTAGHFAGRTVTFTKGSLKGQSSRITNSEYSNNKTKLTVVSMTEAPVDGDEGYIA